MGINEIMEELLIENGEYEDIEWASFYEDEDNYEHDGCNW
jgi:hypothetical protein